MPAVRVTKVLTPIEVHQVCSWRVDCDQTSPHMTVTQTGSDPAVMVYNIGLNIAGVCKFQFSGFDC